MVRTQKDGQNTSGPFFRKKNRLYHRYKRLLATYRSRHSLRPRKGRLRARVWEALAGQGPP